MSVGIKEPETGSYVEVQLTGKLHHSDYEQFVPVLERHMEEGRKLRLLVQMQDFHGWDAGALWDDIKFDFRHFRDIERLALVGESRWEKGMAAFCKPFTTAEVRYFDVSEIDAARAWLSEA